MGRNSVADEDGYGFQCLLSSTSTPASASTGNMLECRVPLHTRSSPEGVVSRSPRDAGGWAAQDLGSGHGPPASHLTSVGDRRDRRSD